MSAILTPREQRSAAIMGMQEIYAQGQVRNNPQLHKELAKLQQQLDEADKRLAENAS